MQDIVHPSAFSAESEHAACLWLQREYAKLMRHEIMLRQMYAQAPMQMAQAPMQMAQAQAMMPMAQAPNMEAYMHAQMQGAYLAPPFASASAGMEVEAGGAAAGGGMGGGAAGGAATEGAATGGAPAPPASPQSVLAGLPPLPPRWGDDA